MKKFLIAMLLVLITTPSLAFGADIPQEQRVILPQGWDPNVITQGELFDDLDTWSMSPSQIQMSYEDAVAQGFEHQILCDGVEDPHCSKALRMHIRAYLAKCSDQVTLYCVEDFSATKDGKIIKGEYVDQYPSMKLKGQFNENKTYLLPAGQSGGLWKLPGLTNDAGSDLYWVNAQLFGAISRNNVKQTFEPMDAYNLWSSISSVSEIEFPSARPIAASDWGGGDGITRAVVDGNRQCLVVGVNKCLVAWPLDENISYSMTIKMVKPLSAWLHGRINKPELALTKSKDGFFHMTLKGNPVTVPTLFAITPWSEASTAIKKRFGATPSGCCGNGSQSWYDSAGRNQASDQMVSDLNMWLPYVNDKSSASPRYWIVRSATWGENVNQNCLVNESISGIVSTNATAYTSGAPTFNKRTMSLDYRVASPHFNQDGNVNVGKYDLQINSKVARCIYGFSSAPISATISIISSNGEKQVATSTMRESNGWIYLSASGFTYSSPTVRVVLKQKSSSKQNGKRS